MKVVHITPDYGAPLAYCGQEMNYLDREGRGTRNPLVGWAVVGFEHDYHIEEPRDEWMFCEACLATPDYALQLLAWS